MPSMRKIGTASSILPFARLPLTVMAPGDEPPAPSVLVVLTGDLTGLPRLLVRLSLPHDFLGGEVDAAGREGVADEEVVRLVGVVVHAVLEVRVLHDGERQL